MNGRARLPVVGAILACVAVVACSPTSMPASGSSPERASASSVADPTPPETAAPAPRVVEGEYLVKFLRRADRLTIQSALTRASFQTVRTYRNLPGLQRVRLAEGADPQQARAALAARDDVEYIEPNAIVHALAVPNDPRFTDMWGLLSPASYGGDPGADINVVPAWDITTGSDNVVIGLIDTGVDYNHEDLSANVFTNTADCNNNGVDDDGDGYIDDCHGIDVVNHDSDPMDDESHGTHVAGTIGAVGNNGIGTVGVAWKVRILPCKFLDKDGYGTTADAIECLDYFAALRARGVNIVATNNSWGGGIPSRALQDAIVAQRQANILFIAAAGNERLDVDQQPEIPCSIDASNVVCVGASSLNDSRAIFSNWGAHTLAVQAPGDSIWSTVPGNKYDGKDGTSMATPHVSGVVALLAAQDPTRNWLALKNLVIAGADPHPDGPLLKYNAPHLNALSSLTCTNTTVLKRLKPSALETLRRPVGAQLVLSALHIQCAQPAGAVNVTVAETGQSILLRDDGAGFDELSGDGIYTGTWTVPAGTDFTLTVDGVPNDPVKVHVEPLLKPGFPVQMFMTDDRINFYGGEGFAVTVGNVTGDAHPEIFAPALLEGPLYGFSYDGRPMTGWPFWDVAVPSVVSLGELDGDTTHSEIVADFTFTGVRRLTPGGRTEPGWPQPDHQLFAPVLADLDGDGRDEVISYPVYHADGSPVSASFEFPPNPIATGIGNAAVADLNADGVPDVVTANREHLWAMNPGGMLFGFPVDDPRPLSEDLFVHPVVGDVDGDGELEIVLAGHADLNLRHTFIDIYSNKGVFKRSIPLGDSSFLSEAVLADLDGDGIPEILVATYSQVHAFKGDGTPMPGWPVQLPGFEFIISYPIVGDVTGSGHTNVVIKSGTGIYDPDTGIPQGKLYVLNPDGTNASGFPLNTTITDFDATPAIADLDLDGHNELLFMSVRGYGYRDALFAYDFSNGPTHGIEWGQYRGSPARRGYYELGHNLPNEVYLTAHAHGAGAITATGINCGNDCIEKYAKGTVVVLTANANAGATFDGWVGDCASQGNPCTLNLQHYASATARFSSPLSVQVTGPGTVGSSPVGISCPTNCAHVFPGDSVVTIFATPSAGADFDGWSGGGCSGLNAVCRVLIDAAKTVTAKFVTSRTLTVSRDGAGSGAVTSTPAGIACGSTCSAEFAPDSTVTLTAQAVPGSYFVKWSGACTTTQNGCTVTMDLVRSVVATFAISPVLTVQLTGSGSGTITSSPAGINCGTQCSMAATSPNDIIQLTQQPNENSEFVSWGGACTNNGPICFAFMTSDQTVTGNFVFRPYLYVSTSGIGGKGHVTSSAGGIDCGGGGPCFARLDGNTQVTLTAVATSDGVFQGWSGACSGVAATCTVTMNARQDVGATFVNAPVTPPPSSGGSGGSGGGGGGGGGGRSDALTLGMLGLIALLRLCRGRGKSRDAPAASVAFSIREFRASREALMTPAYECSMRRITPDRVRSPSAPPAYDPARRTC